MAAKTTDFTTAAIEFVDANPGYIRQDRDAMMDGWDPMAYTLDSIAVQVFADEHDWDEDAVDAIADVVLDTLGF